MNDRGSAFLTIGVVFLGVGVYRGGGVFLTLGIVFTAIGVSSLVRGKKNKKEPS